MTSNGTNSYIRDARNRLTAISGGYSATYTYDALDRRTLNSTGTSYLYDAVNAVAELSGSNAISATFISRGGPDEMFERTDAAGTQTFISDALGSTLALTDSTGALPTQYTYEPYGRTSVTGAANGNAFQYTGCEADTGGLYYYRAGYYDPSIGRFISEDPLEFGGGDANLYAYMMDIYLTQVAPISCG